MASRRETPRQRIINILYLALLASLDLNVSDTLVIAFKKINDSLETSKSTVDNMVDQLFASFENTKLKEEPERARPIYEKATQARQIVAELNEYINSIKAEFEEQGGGYDETTGDLVHRKNVDIPTDVMINKKKGIELKDRINQ